MRIALRSSGGRGEYELTGSHGAVAASDLFDHQLDFQITPELIIAGRHQPLRVQGKPRIRLLDQRQDRHAYAVLANVLLLPVPIRELRQTAPGTDFVRDGGYSITDIDVDLVRANGGAELRPTRLWLSNSEGLVRSVEFAERMATVQAAWAAARETEGRLAVLVRRHEAAVEGGTHLEIGSAASAVRAEVGTETDVLPVVAALLGVGLDHPPPDGGVVVERVPEEEGQEVDPAEAVRQTISKWRKQAVRDAAGRRFSEAVKAAYDYCCVVSSHRYPKLDSAVSAAVDGAHILPYRRYDLNEVVNGLCLCKICHWAFDNGVIRIDYRKTRRQYVMSIPKAVRREARANRFDLSFFEQYEGPLARARLPQAEALWPSPRYLEELNNQLFGET
jgi:hypothetical protein